MNIQGSADIFGTILASLPDGLLIVDGDGDIILANRQAEKIFGYLSEELPGQKVELLLPERFALKHPEHRNRFFKNLQIRPMETGLTLPGRRKDGSEFPLEISLSPVKSGEVTLTIASIRDITEQTRLKAKTSSQAERVNRHNIALQSLTKSQFTDFETTLISITKSAATALNVERVSVWLFNEDRSELICNDLFISSKDSHEKGACLKRVDFPNYLQEIDKNKTIAADDAQHNPLTSELTKTYFEPLGITSILDSGIFSQSRTLGVVCAENVGPRREWLEEEITFLNAIANLVVLAMEASERQQSEMELENHKKRLEKLAQLSIDDLHEQEETLRSITASIQSAIIMIDGQCHVSFWNESAETIFGWSRQEAMGQSLHKLIVSEKYSAQLHKAFQPLQQPGEKNLHGKALELPARRKSGEEFPVELVFSAINKKDSRHVVGIINDISSRRKAEEGLLASEQKFKSIFDYSRDGIVKVNAKTRKFLSGNKAICRMLGYELAELLHLGVENVHPEEERSALVKLFDRAATLREDTILDIPMKRKDGTVFYVDISTGTVDIGANKCVIASVRDITKQKQKIEESLQQMEELERFNRLSIGREQIMIRLKGEVNELLKQLGQQEKYRIVK